MTVSSSAWEVMSPAITSWKIHEVFGSFYPQKGEAQKDNCHVFPIFVHLRLGLWWEGSGKLSHVCQNIFRVLPIKNKH